jgi:hypothetical protein
MFMSSYQYTIENVDISMICAGDTVMRDGIMKTVCKNNLGRDALLGRTLFGDSYHSGHKRVERVVFVRPKMPSLAQEG